MHSVRRTSWMTTLLFAVSGAGAGILVQIFLSSRGRPPFIPPVSLAITLVVLAAAVLVLGLVLRRRVTRDHGGNVNPFAAVRVLALARASQFAGALFGGFGAGLSLAVLLRSVPPPAATWLPMVLALAAGAVLTACGAIAEHLCRVPPDDDDAEGAGETTPDAPVQPA